MVGTNDGNKLVVPKRQQPKIILQPNVVDKSLKLDSKGWEATE